jgi:hypothetical protein
MFDKWKVGVNDVVTYVSAILTRERQAFPLVCAAWRNFVTHCITCSTLFISVRWLTARTHRMSLLCHSLSLTTSSVYLITCRFTTFEGCKHFVYSRSSFPFALYIKLRTCPSCCNLCFSPRFKTSHANGLLLGYWRLARELARSLCCGSCLLYATAAKCSYSVYTGRSYSDYIGCAYSAVTECSLLRLYRTFLFRLHRVCLFSCYRMFLMRLYRAFLFRLHRVCLFSCYRVFFIEIQGVLIQLLQDVLYWVYTVCSLFWL